MLEHDQAQKQNKTGLQKKAQDMTVNQLTQNNYVIARVMYDV